MAAKATLLSGMLGRARQGTRAIADPAKGRAALARGQRLLGSRAATQLPRRASPASAALGSNAVGKGSLANGQRLMNGLNGRLAVDTVQGYRGSPNILLGTSAWGQASLMRGRQAMKGVATAPPRSPRLTRRQIAMGAAAGAAGVGVLASANRSGNPAADSGGGMYSYSPRQPIM